MRVPEGWKLVPIKPTKEMKAACRVAGKAQVWDDMIAAAPNEVEQGNEQIQKDEDDAMESAWQALKPELGPSKWTTGESFTYRGFFCWGWEARRQYNSDQIDALKATGETE